MKALFTLLIFSAAFAYGQKAPDRDTSMIQLKYSIAAYGIDDSHVKGLIAEIIIHTRSLKQQGRTTLWNAWVADLNKMSATSPAGSNTQWAAQTILEQMDPAIFAASPTYQKAGFSPKYEKERRAVIDFLHERVVGTYADRTKNKNEALDKTVGAALEVFNRITALPEKSAVEIDHTGPKAQQLSGCQGLLSCPQRIPSEDFQVIPTRYHDDQTYKGRK